MFCPNIKDECVGEKCRDWDGSEGRCRIGWLTELNIENQKQLLAQGKALLEAQESMAETQRYSILGTKLFLTQMLESPTLSDEQKELIQKALRAPSSEAAERLLRDAGLIE